MPKSGIGVYGSVEIKRVYCRKCRTMALVLEGKKQCCDEPSKSRSKMRFKMSESYGKRNKAKSKKKAIRDQNGICPYCDNLFGYFYERNGVVSKSTVHIDHKSPFSYSVDDSKKNLIACCSICNLLKSAFVFENIEILREFIYEKRKAKGYKILS